MTKLSPDDLRMMDLYRQRALARAAARRDDDGESGKGQRTRPDGTAATEPRLVSAWPSLKGIQGVFRGRRPAPPDLAHQL